jgi:signal transduction histidine kinase
MKVTGASTVVLAAAVGTAVAFDRTTQRDTGTLLIMLGALTVSMVINVALVLIALRPIRALEETAESVSRGDLGTRVPTSLLADRDIARVGHTFNRVLDELIVDRARMRRLASEVILEGDRQRASISKELHDSAAQSLAAIMFEVSAAAQTSADPEQAARLDTIRGYAMDVLDEVRLLAHRVHPRLLDDLGLVAALERLVRSVGQSSNVRVDLDTGCQRVRVPTHIATVLYRVAEEAVSNAIRHGSAKSIGIHLSTDASNVRLSVNDDGRGFDAAARRPELPGVGLFSMRQRVVLAGGIFDIASRPGTGTVISAVLPFSHTDTL